MDQNNNKKRSSTKKKVLMKSAEKEQWYKNKKMLGIIGGAVAAIIVLIIVLCVTQKDYKVVDLTDMPIIEACSVARSHGWKVSEPIGVNYTGGQQRKIDCDNDYGIVAKYEYNADEHIVELKWKYKILKENEYSGKTVSEICELAKGNHLELKVGTYKKEYNSAESCDDNRIPDEVEQDSSSGKITMLFLKSEAEKEKEAKEKADSTSSSNPSTNTYPLGKCKTGEKYSISQNGHYVIGNDIPSGTYVKDTPKSRSIWFDLFKTQSDYDSGKSDIDNLIILDDEKTVQLNNGNIVDNVVDGGDIICK